MKVRLLLCLRYRFKVPKNNVLNNIKFLFTKFLITNFLTYKVPDVTKFLIQKKLNSSVLKVVKFRSKSKNANYIKKKTEVLPACDLL
jgi:hypothetical protein